MFVNTYMEKETAISIDPNFKDVVSVVGDPFEEKIRKLKLERRKILEELNVGKTNILVMVLSTFGPYSLFEHCGIAIIEAMEKCDPKYIFALCPHPNLYRQKLPGRITWGDYVRRLKGDRFIIVEPDSDKLSLIAVADVILTDYTSLALKAVGHDIPFVFTPFRDYCVSKNSIISKVRDLSPTISSDASDLSEKLEEVLTSFPHEKVREIAKELNPHRGECFAIMKNEIYDLLMMQPPI